MDEILTTINLDEEGKYQNLGIFKKDTLNDLEIRGIERPGITSPSLGQESIFGFNKLVGKVDGFNTRITQNEQNIILQANSIAGNTASITINSENITSLVSDVEGNTSQITQNSENINLKVSKDEIISQINISEESILIEAKRIEINGETTFSSGYNPSEKETPDGAQEKVNTLSDSLGDLATLDMISDAKLDNTIIEGGYLKTSLLTANNIIAGTFIGPIYRTSAEDERIELNKDNNKLLVYNSSGENIANFGISANGSNGGNIIYAKNLSADSDPVCFLEGYGDTNVIRINGPADTNMPMAYFDAHNNERPGIVIDTKNGDYAGITLNTEFDGAFINFNGKPLMQVGDDLYWNGTKIN